MKNAGTISLIYFIVGVLWIFLYDTSLKIRDIPGKYSNLQGFEFVSITTVLLFLQIKSGSKKYKNFQKKIRTLLFEADLIPVFKSFRNKPSRNGNHCHCFSKSFT